MRQVSVTALLDRSREFVGRVRREGNRRISCKDLRASGVDVAKGPACAEAQVEMRDCEERPVEGWSAVYVQ